MFEPVSRYSLAVRLCSLLVFGLLVVNAVLIFGFAVVPMDNVSGFARAWMTFIGILNALLVVGVAFQAADAGLAGGPAESSARQRLMGMTNWLPVGAIAIVSLSLISSALGRLFGDEALATGYTSPRQLLGLVILVGWSLFGWAAVLRWLKQGPPTALMILTRVMELLALAALALDLVEALSVNWGTLWGVARAGVGSLDALTQALAVVVCVEAVSDPNPSRLTGLLGHSLRALTVLAWAVLVGQLGSQALALMVSAQSPLLGLVGPLTSVAGGLLAFSERSLLASTLWAREGRLLGMNG